MVVPLSIEHIVRYGIFNTESGNMIEAYSDRDSALALIADMIREDADATDHLSLVTLDGGKISDSQEGEDLRAAVLGTSNAVAV